MPPVDLHLTYRRDACRHVQDVGGLGFGGHSDSDGVGAEHRLSPEGRYCKGPCISHTDPDHILSQRHHGVIAGYAIMVAVRNRCEPEMLLLGFLNASLHHTVGSYLT